MIIKRKPLDPIGEQLVESNNQHEKRLDLLSKMYFELKKEIQSIKDDNERQRSMNF